MCVWVGGCMCVTVCVCVGVCVYVCVGVGMCGCGAYLIAGSIEEGAG